MAANPTDIWARKYLLDRGVKGQDIGYQNGAVTVGGVDFFKPSTIKNGQAMGSQAELDKAYNAYQQLQGEKKVNSALSELDKAVATPFKPYEPAQPFTFSPESDPQYQAALRRAQANAQSASGNALAQLNSRGLLNSTISADRLGQIQQAEYGRVSDTVLPQLMQQAYGRYMDAENQRYQQYKDAYGMSRDHIRDLGNTINIQNGMNQQLTAEEQRQLDNANRDWQNQFAYGQAIGTFGNGQQTTEKQRMNQDASQWKQQFDRAKYESDRNYQYQVQQDAIRNGQWQQQFQLDVDQFGFQKASEMWSQAFQEDQAAKDNQYRTDRAAADDFYRNQQLQQSMTENERSSAQQAYQNVANSGLVLPETTTDQDGNTVKTGRYVVPDVQKFKDYVLSLNLPDNVTDSIFLQYGQGQLVK